MTKLQVPFANWKFTEVATAAAFNFLAAVVVFTVYSNRRSLALEVRVAAVICNRS